MNLVYTTLASLGVIFAYVVVWVHVVASLDRMYPEADSDAKTVIGFLTRDYGRGIAYTLAVFVYVGIVMDALFNWTWGTLFFRELPRETLFTDRVQRWYDKSRNTPRPSSMVSLSSREKEGVKWAKRINLIWPGHIKR